MSTSDTPAVDTAPIPETTTLPDIVVELKSGDEGPPEPKPEKTFTQAELDAIVAKRVSREARKLAREHAQPVPVPPVPVVLPNEDDFQTPEEYAEAAADARVEAKLRTRAAAEQAAQVRADYAEREEAVREKYDDFEQVAYNPNVQITQYMVETLLQSELGPEVLYHLGMNPKEAERISKLAPLVQAREIGKLEAKVAANPPVKTTSTAPDPITPVKPSANGAKTYDTTDPRAAKEMSTSDWIAADRDRQRKAWDKSRNR